MSTTTDQPLLGSETNTANSGVGYGFNGGASSPNTVTGHHTITMTSPNAISTTVKSTDGKFHRLVYSPETHTLEFTLQSSDSKLTKHALTLHFNEILGIRNEPVKMSSGLPLPAANQNRKSVGPNALYIYYGYRNNVYTWRVREIVALFTTTTEKKEWASILQGAWAAVACRPRKLLVFINPFGGKGKANQIYTRQVEPLLNLVGAECEVIKTERADHAVDILKKELDAERWNSIDGIVSVGGDGLFNEVLSSSIIRTQEEHRKDIGDANIDSLATPRMRFGIIGAGSANSIVSSVHGVDDCPTAAIHIALGSKCLVDVCTVHEDKKLLRISANAISYGWLGDVLHDSERYRCMGPIRYQWSALRTSIRHPTYFGRVSFTLDDEAYKDGARPTIPPCTTPCDVCEGKATSPHPYHWQTDYTHVICCVVPCISPFTPYGLAPFKTGVGDGYCDLALVPKVSRCENMGIMSTVSLYGAKELIRSRRPNVYVYRVSRWSFTPAALLEGSAGTGTEEQLQKQRQGSWNLDGEILPQPTDKPLHFRLHPRLIAFFGRELDLEDPRYKKCLCCAKHKRYSNIVVIG